MSVLLLAAALGTAPVALPPVSCGCVQGRTCRSGDCAALGGNGKCPCRAATKPPVTVYYFTLPDCVPCKVYRPTFLAFAEVIGAGATFTEVDAQDPAQADLVRRYQIGQVPRIVVTDGEYATTFLKMPWTLEEFRRIVNDPSNGRRPTRTLPKAAN